MPTLDRRSDARGPDRRQDLSRRKAIEEMSPEEKDQELGQLRQERSTSKLTGLPNRTAFDEAAPAPTVGMSDADALKAFNDKFGYQAGNQLLQAKAEALREAGVDAYHEKGDEFLYRADSPDELQTKLENARQILRNKEITVTTPNGGTKTLKGADFSYGIGNELSEAEAGLKTHKAEREARGERARGELRGISEVNKLFMAPPEAAPVTPERMRLDATLAPPGPKKPEVERVAAPKVEEPAAKSALPVKASSMPEVDVARHEAQLSEIDTLLQRQPDAAMLREARRKAVDQAGALHERKRQIKDRLTALEGEENGAEEARQLRVENRGLNAQIRRLSEMYTRAGSALGETPSHRYYDGSTRRQGIENNTRLSPEGRAEALRKFDSRVQEARASIKDELGRTQDPARKRQLLRMLQKHVLVTTSKGIKTNANFNPTTQAWEIATPEISLKLIRRLNKEIGDGRHINDLVSLVPDGERDEIRALKETDPVGYREAVQKAATNWVQQLRSQVGGRLDASKARVAEAHKVMEPSSGRMEAPAIGSARQIIRDLKAGKRKLATLSEREIGGLLSQPGVIAQEFGPATNKPSTGPTGEQIFRPREDYGARFMDRLRQEKASRQSPIIEANVPPEKPEIHGLPEIAQRLIARWFYDSHMTYDKAQKIVEDNVPSALLKAMQEIGPVLGVPKHASQVGDLRFEGLHAGSLSKTKIPLELQQRARSAATPEWRRATREGAVRDTAFFLQARSKVHTWLTDFSLQRNAAHEFGHAIYERVSPKHDLNVASLFPEAAREIVNRYAGSGYDLLHGDPRRLRHEIFAQSFAHWYEGQGTPENRMKFLRIVQDGLDAKGQRLIRSLMLEGKMHEGAPEISVKATQNNINDWRDVQGKDAEYAMPAFGRNKPQSKPVNPALERIQEARDTEQARPRFLDRLRRLPLDQVRNFYEQFVYIPGGTGPSRMAEVQGVKISKAAIEARTGQPLKLEDSPFVEMRLAYGGGTGLVEETGLRLAAVANRMEDAGLHSNFIEALDLAAYKHAWTTLDEKYSQAKQDEVTHSTALNRLLFDIKSGKRTMRGAADELQSLRKNVRDARADKKRFADTMLNRQVVPEGLTPTDITSAEQNMQKTLGPGKWQQIQDARQEIFDITREGLTALHREGLISNDLYVQLVHRGDYVPVHRVVAERIKEANSLWGGHNTSLDMRQSKVIQKLEGSEKVNVNPLHDVLSTMEDIHIETQRNQAARKLIEFAAKDPTGWGTLVRQLSDNEQPREGYGTVGFYKDGTPLRYEVPTEISDTVRMAHPTEMDLVTGTLLKTARRIFQYGTTLANLDFAVPNVIRDLQDRQILSKANHTAVQLFTQAIGEWSSAFRDVVAKNDNYRDFLKSRAAYSTFQKRLVPEDFLAEQRNGIFANLKRGHVIKGIEQLNNALEEATKLSTYKRLRGKGMSETEAAWETRNYGGSPDFGARGQKSPMANLLLMFFNANVRGVGRTFGRFAEDPKRLMWFLGAATLASLAQHRYNSQFTDEEGKPEDRHVSDVDKQNYFHFLRPEVYQTSQGAIRHQQFQVPKGHVAKVLYNPIQKTIDDTMSKHGFDGAQTALDLISSIMPGQGNLERGHILEGLGRTALSSANPIIREPFEQALNYDSFRGVPIISKGMEEIEPQEKYVPTTPQAARDIAQVTSKVPGLHDVPLVGPVLTEPKRIEHAVQGFTGGVGKRALDLYDLANKTAGRGEQRTMPLEGDEALGKYPVVGRFVGKIQDQEEKDLSKQFYDAAAKAREVQQTFHRFARQDPERAKEYVADPDRARLLAMARIFGDVEKKLSEGRNVELMIRNDQNKTLDEKKQAMHDLYRARIQVLRAFVNGDTRKLQSWIGETN
jgi:GGDEF domain-containing protein